LASRYDDSGVIIADDDPLIRSVLRSKLEGLGQKVFVAKDGLQAVDLAWRARAALILLDFSMPNMNGLEACRHIRASPFNATTPVVALTGLNVENIEAAALRAGVTLFLNKPIGMAQLLGVLSRYLPLDESTRRSVAASAARANEIDKMSPRRQEIG
jgi:CheY-like chemotaxis protein